VNRARRSVITPDKWVSFHYRPVIDCAGPVSRIAVYQPPSGIPHQQSPLRRRLSVRQRYAVPIRATGGHTFSDMRSNQCGPCPRLPDMAAVVRVMLRENSTTVDCDG
jgi:hypothetical protein